MRKQHSDTEEEKSERGESGLLSIKEAKEAGFFGEGAVLSFLDSLCFYSTVISRYSALSHPHLFPPSTEPSLVIKKNN